MIVKRQNVSEYNRRQLHERMDFKTKNQFFKAPALQSMLETKGNPKDDIQSQNPSKEQQLEFAPVKSTQQNDQEKDELISKLKEMIDKLKSAINSR